MRPLMLFALAGCQQVFGLEETVLKMADARIDAPGCADAMFVDPRKVDGASGVFGNDFDPHMSADPRELWFSRDEATGNSYDIYVATRTSAAGSFERATLFEHNSALRDFDAQTTANGLVMAFVSSRVGAESVFETRRASMTGAWSLPAPVQAVPDGDAYNGIDMSVDGLTIYYANGDFELRAVRRTSLADPFVASADVLATGVSFPSVSPDELELFYQRSGAREIYRRTRASTTQPFGPESLVLLDAGDPDISSDSSQMFYADGGIYVMSRACN